MEGRAAARPSASRSLQPTEAGSKQTAGCCADGRSPHVLLLVGVVAANLTWSRPVQRGRMRRLCCRNQR
eukprot:1585908-Amphidinium_carterae.1